MVHIIKKCPGYFSAYCSGFNVLLKSVQGIIQRKFQYSAYCLTINYSASGSGFSVLLKMPRVLFKLWFRIQRIIKKCPGYYSAYGSVFSVLLKKCPGYFSASCSEFSVLLKNVQGIIQSMVQVSTYY